MKEIEEDEEIRILGGSHWNGENKEGVYCPVQKDRKKPFLNIPRGVLYVISTLLIVGLAAAMIYTFYLEKRFYGFEYPLSRPQKEVLASLQHPAGVQRQGITHFSDSYLGVQLEFYKIEGLKAELCDSVPSLDNKDVFLTTRCSDYRFDGNQIKIIGDYVHHGELISKSNWRAGYFAILNGNAEIGIGRRPEMRRYLLKNDGSMFRQFALVSAGVKCASQYKLKGKVTRCAYARTPDNALYYIESVYPETLYGFSDALIEFGFIDAVYVTGGAHKNLFYRDSTGTAHGNFTDDKPHKMVIWKKGV